MSPLLLIAIHFLVCVFSPVAGSVSSTDVGRTAMVEMLDDLESLMTGNQVFDREYLATLRNCMDELDSSLTTSQDNAWQGIRDYWASNGTGDDFWGKNTLVYMESNETLTPQIGMPIYEPCGHSSNVAYYHSSTEICARMKSEDPFSYSDEFVKALGVSFSGLAMGSSFMHMSHTDLGGNLDTSSISVLSYLIHQASLSALTGATPIITDLQFTKRKQTALEIVHEYKNMYKDMPVDQWREHVKEIDVPEYFLSFSGIVVTCATVGFSEEHVDQMIPFLSNLLHVPEEYEDFITNHYVPEIRSLTKDLHLNIIQKKNFLEDALSAVGKIIYAFMWQEDVLTQNPIFLNETVNGIGNEYIPIVNGFLNDLNSFTFYEQDFQDGQDVYPGDFWCNPVIPHAKWHVESALGLLDLAYLADVAHRHLFSMGA